MSIVFHPETHTYEIDGRQVPGVTQVLDDVIRPYYGGDAAYNFARGNALHAGYAILGRGGEIAECDPDQRPYYDAWLRWRAFYGVQVVEVETVVGTALYQYAGTFDARVYIDGMDYLVDFKATIIPELAGWQLAAYAIAHGHDTMPRVAVQIEPSLQTGARLMWYESKSDIRKYNNEWLAILTAYRCRRKMGIPERKAE